MINNRVTHKFGNSIKIAIYFFTVLLFAISLSWNIYSHQKSHLAILKNIAETSLAKDKMFRLWATSHGGVYVPVDDRTPPNPYLVAENKNVVIEGKDYTLMNPAYILRQMMEEFSGLYGTKSHITALKPTNPNNKPDQWEIDALKKFAQGEKRYYSFYEENNKKYLRYMTPYQTLERCLKCHAHEGYKVGEVRGGVSIKIPLDTFEEYEKTDYIPMIVSHLVLLLVALLFTWVVFRKIEKDNRELLLQQEMLVQQSKLSAMGMMIENIAHQWRQPLGALSLVVDNIEFSYNKGKLDDASLDKAVTKSRNLIGGMSSTIDDFRNFFKPDREKKVFSITDNIDEVLTLMSGSVKKHGVSIEKNLQSSCSIYGFSNEYSQVLLNIFVNAKDALTQNKIEEPCIKIETTEKEGVCTLKISDNAGGIPEEIIGRLFDPYFTTKGEGKGTGIGLYMSKMIIEEHMKGTLEVRNGDEGAVFEISVKSTDAG